MPYQARLSTHASCIPRYEATTLCASAFKRYAQTRIVEVTNGTTSTKEKFVRPMALVFDYDLLKESYEINLETVVGAEYDPVEDDRDVAQTSPIPVPQPTLFEDSNQAPF